MARPPADRPPPRPPLLQPGAVVDHFRIMRPLGRGGMGEVYLARDTRLGRKVALKLIPSVQLDPESENAGFLFEARAIARLNHPHIVTIYEVGQTNKIPYLALEYLEGQNLRHRLREGRPSLRETIRMGVAIADALREAHRGGVLHRDLKPENVVIPRDGRLRVVDFGLAKLTDRAHKGAKPPEGEPEGDADEYELIGSPRYMAPERWLREQSTEATDIWSLGMMLYEMVSGRHPLQDMSQGRMALLVTAPDPVPRMDDPGDAPAEVVDLIERCVQKRPENRLTAADVHDILERLLLRDRVRPTEETSPFRGLLPFAERHADFFFGRDAEIAAFLERMRDQPVLPVVGPSGAGKSSFVQAGIVPRLREQAAWSVLQIRPGSRPFYALATRLLRDATTSRSQITTPQRHRSQPPSSRRGPLAGGPDDESQPLPSLAPEPEGAEDLADKLLESPSFLTLMLQEHARQRGCRVLLFVDQLEELYTLVDDDETRRRFMQAICSAADDPQDPVRAVFALRDDFLVRLAQGTGVREALSQVTVIRSPEPEALKETLLSPLERVDHHFEDTSLPDEMIAQVHGEPACLPLLQFVARVLWDRRDRQRKLLLRSTYEELGGVAGALARHADGILDGLSPVQVGMARDIFLRLVTAEGTRRVTSRSRVLEGLLEGAPEVLGRLTASRLVTARKARGEGEGAAELELAHESLVRTWTRLSRWIEESREELRFLADAESAATFWERRGFRDEDLWQGDTLQDAVRALERSEVPSRVVEFLQASRRRDQRRTQRKRVAVWSGFLLLAAIATGLGLLSWILAKKELETQRQRQRAEARHAESQREGARAALVRGDLLEARAKLRSSLETRDSSLARVLFWRLQRSPLVWKRKLGATIYLVDFAPDGHTVAAACLDGSVYLFDARTRAVKRVLREHKDHVLSVGFSPDGTLLASGGRDGQVILWDMPEGRPRLLAPKHDGSVFELRFSPDGKRLATGASDGKIRIWDVNARKQLRVLEGHSEFVYGVDFSPDSKRVATSAKDGTVRLWEAETGKQSRVLRGHKGGVMDVQFSPDGKLLATAGRDKSVRLFNAHNGHLVRVLWGHRALVKRVAFHPSGTTLASGSHDHTIRLWDVASGVHKRTISGHGGTITGLSYRADGERLASAGYDDTVRVWNVSEQHPDETFTGHTGPVVGVSFTPDGKTLASGSYDKSVRLWDVQTGKQKGILQGHAARVMAVRFSPDGKTLATSSYDKSVRLWDVASAQERLALFGHTDPVLSVSFRPDGTMLASASTDKTVRLWDVSTGEQTKLIPSPGGPVYGVTFSSDGASLASANHDGSVHVWSADDGVHETRLAGHDAPVYGVEFLKGGKRLVTGGTDGTVRLWDRKSGEFRVVGRQKGRVYWIALSPDDAHVGASSSDGVGRIWSLKTGEPASSAPGQPVVLRGHRGELNYLTMSPDGRLAATGGDDGTVRLWEVSDGRPAWRAPLLLSSPPALLSHQGWRALDESSSPESLQRLAAQSWARAVAERSNLAATIDGSPIVCIATRKGEIEIWDRVADQSILKQSLPELEQLVAVPEGCVVRSAAKTELFARSLAAKLLVEQDSTAIAFNGTDILVAADRSVLTFSSKGERKSSLPGHVGVTSLTSDSQRLLLGHRDGNVDLVSLSNGKTEFSFEDVPASPVVRMALGHRDTVVIGFANGLLGIWNLQTGKRMAWSRLHGAVVHLLVKGRKLYAATELGSVIVWDLGVLTADYCELLGEVWSKVPVVWEGGRPVLRPKPLGHLCAVRD